jgi:ABC-2 type transport system ATP-binding protein
LFLREGFISTRRVPPSTKLEPHGSRDLSFAVETFALSKRYPHQRGLLEVLAGRALAETTALNEVSLNVEEGEVFGLLGPNGSGKTTFLKLLSTILAPTSGTARIFGLDIVESSRSVRALVSLVTGEERSLFWRLTGRQNLEFFASLYASNGIDVRHKVDELLELFDLKDVGRIMVGEYSTGMKQRLAVARGLINGPKLLFLDEPTRGLDPVAAHALLAGVKERAVDYFANTVILTTHIMREVEQLCQRIAVLNRGNVAYQGTVEGLRTSLARHDRYLLRVRSLSEAVIVDLQKRNGMKSCESSVSSDGVSDLELVFATEILSLSEVLRHLLSSNVEILKCTKKEQSLEEMFRAIFDAAR